MNKIVGALVIIILLAAGAAASYGIWREKDRLSVQFPPIDQLPETPTAPVSEDPERYFRERLVSLTVEDLGQPADGIDAELLRSAFPGILGRDFEGVRGQGGVYRPFAETEAVDFIHDDVASPSSAARMITKEGYEKLLRNLSLRLGLPVRSNAQVDAVIAVVDTGIKITASLNQGASALAVTVMPIEILEDSRCPVDVTCIQAGTVRIRTLLTSGLGEARQVFVLNQPITTEVEEVTLIAVRPRPIAFGAGNRPVRPSDYAFDFLVRKRN